MFVLLISSEAWQIGQQRAIRAIHNTEPYTVLAPEMDEIRENKWP